MPIMMLALRKLEKYKFLSRFNRALQDGTSVLKSIESEFYDVCWEFQLYIPATQWFRAWYSINIERVQVGKEEQSALLIRYYYSVASAKYLKVDMVKILLKIASTFPLHNHNKAFKVTRTKSAPM
ncbi:hypothetical protein ACOYXV_04440 [Aeromonas veronii]